MNKLKQIGLYSLLTLSILHSQPTYACTPVGCMSGGHHQDALVIGEILSISNAGLHVVITFVFPQNKIMLQSKDDEILVKIDFLKNNAHQRAKDNDKASVPTLMLTDTDSVASSQLTKQEPEYSKGKKYILSLNKETKWFSPSFYYPAWGLFEVEGSKYSDMKLIRYKGFEFEELQALLNSGGASK